jgi:hypothetical protein
MKKSKRNFILLVLIFSACSSFAQVNTIVTACPFLMITPDARAGGMGESGVATSPDVNSIFWNTSKLAFAKKKFGAEVSYLPWMRALIPDAYLAQTSLYMKPDSVSAFTASARYFSGGEYYSVSPAGTIGTYKPQEYAIDAGYTRKIAKYWSAGMNWKYIHSNIYNGLAFSGTNIRAGQSLAFDLSAYYYDRDRVKIFGIPCTMMIGASLSNVGNKISYTTSISKQFLPADLRIGQGFEMNSGDHKILFTYQVNKLLVPTQPVYELDSNGRPKINPNTGRNVILEGKDPDVSVAQGMLQSFYDAPGGAKEEFREINFQLGAEYWYRNSFVVRAGYFHEAKTKGYRQFLTLGAGVKYNFVTLDFAYIIPTNGQRNPLQNTLWFSLQFEFDQFKKIRAIAG